MDYLNYGKQVQQKPQGFDQQKVQLSKEDFNFGDLNQQKTQPPVEPQIKNELIPLFAIPVVISDYKDGYDEELEWIKNLDCKDVVEEENNIYYNKQTKDTFVLDRPQLANIREFIEKEIIINPIDYYFSNPIARSSKTMNECRQVSKKFTFVGIEKAS